MDSAAAGVGAVTSLPAFATTQVPIPEPTALSLIDAGIGGGVIAWRIYRRRQAVGLPARRGRSDVENAAVAYGATYFGTDVEAPRAGHTGMTIGLEGRAKPHHLSLRWMLLSPFGRRVRRMPPMRRTAG